jgi:heme-degrading monooxygenase HmoA
MILETAHLSVKPGMSAAFESAMTEAKTIISSMEGFIALSVRPCFEAENLYLLEVRWETLEHHTEGFRGSAEYQEWKALLHHFYEPFPEVFHYGEPIITA